jgi:hypothetical protein
MAEQQNLTMWRELPEIELRALNPGTVAADVRRLCLPSQERE